MQKKIFLICSLIVLVSLFGRNSLYAEDDLSETKNNSAQNKQISEKIVVLNSEQDLGHRPNNEDNESEENTNNVNEDWEGEFKLNNYYDDWEVDSSLGITGRQFSNIGELKLINKNFSLSPKLNKFLPFIKDKGVLKLKAKGGSLFVDTKMGNFSNNNGKKNFTDAHFTGGTDIGFQGSFNTLKDTEKNRDGVELSLKLNLPSGKSRLSRLERLSNPNSNLISYEFGGKGFNYTFEGGYIYRHEKSPCPKKTCVADNKKKKSTGDLSYFQLDNQQENNEINTETALSKDIKNIFGEIKELIDDYSYNFEAGGGYTRYGSFDATEEIDDDDVSGGYGFDIRGKFEIFPFNELKTGLELSYTFIDGYIDDISNTYRLKIPIVWEKGNYKFEFVYSFEKSDGEPARATEIRRNDQFRKGIQNIFSIKNSYKVFQSRCPCDGSFSEKIQLHFNLDGRENNTERPADSTFFATDDFISVDGGIDFEKIYNSPISLFLDLKYFELYSKGSNDIDSDFSGIKLMAHLKYDLK